MPRPVRRTLAAVWLTAAAIALVTVPPERPAAAQPAPAGLPPDLAFVRANALGFAHLRVTDVWTNPELKQFRNMFEKAGPEAFAALDGQFGLKLSTVERVTVVAVPPNPMKLVGIVRFNAPLDRTAVRRAYAPAGKAVRAGDAELFLDERAGVGLYFPDDRTLAYADPDVLTEYMNLPPVETGPLSQALRAAAGKPLMVAVNVTALPIPPVVTNGLPDEFKPLLKAQLVTASMTIGGKEPVLDARVVFPTPEDAAAGEKAMRAAATIARSGLDEPRSNARRILDGRKREFAPEQPAGGSPPTRRLEDLPDVVAAVAGLGALATLDEILADLPLKRNGAAVSASVTLPPWTARYLGSAAVSAGLFAPSVSTLHTAANKSIATNHLKIVGLACQNHHDQFLRFPGSAITDKAGKPLLSWRVAILPFHEQNALYREFKLDEPWDSEHNKKLIPRMPKVYADPRSPAEPGMTYLKAFVGKGTPFQPGANSLNLATVTDGSSNTILAVAGGDPVVWTKPDDVPFDPEKPLPDLSKPFRDLLAVFCDGSVRSVSWADEKALKAMATAQGGEVIRFP